MKTIAQLLLAAIVSSGLMALPLHAEEQVQRYIVVLKQRSGPVPDVASLGGKIEFRQDDQLVVTMPPGALAALKADPKVRYVERVGGTPSDDDAPLIGVPSDPRPGPSTQPQRFTPHALGGLAWDSGTYAYDGAGNIVSIGTDNYLYDGVQRLRQSSTQGTSEAYTYDGFGNMTGKTNNGQTQIVPAVETATNRYIGTGYTYNEAGAVKTDGSYGFSYDALGQPLSKIYNNDSSKLEYYVYTPGDERIGVQRGGWWTWSIRDEGGKVLRQYKSSATNPSAPALWLEDFVWRDGLLLGSQRPVEMGGHRHFHLDHLGSPRLVTSDNGQMVSYHDYYPFGDEHSPVSQEVAGGFDREDPMKFTGHERDYAGGMGGEDGHAIDDMHARYYTATVGRFFSPDPLLGNLLRPQSWNRYAYVLNSPLNLIDQYGLKDDPPQPPDCPPGTPTDNCGISVKPPPPPKPTLPKPRPTTWYEDNVAEFARARAQPLLKHRVMPYRYGRTPDYYTFTFGTTSQFFVGGGVTLTLDRNGRLYGGPMGLIGTPGKGVAIIAGWLMTKDAPDPDTITGFISGYSASFSLSGGLQAGVSWGGPGSGFAEEYGLSIPGLGGSPSWSFGPLQTGLSWPEK